MAKTQSPSRNKGAPLNSAEVLETRTSGNSSGRGRAAQSRALDVTTTTITLLHQPAGLEVSGSVPPGHYTRPEMKKLKDELYARLLGELERLVVAKLRVAGR